MDQSAPDLSFELFVILERFSQRCGHYVPALAPLTEGPCASGVVRVDVHYRKDTDVALLAFTLRGRRDDDEPSSQFLEACLAADAPVLDPGRLGPADRADFYQSYLLEYNVLIDRCDNCQTGLMRLCADLSIDVSARPPAPPRARRRSAGSLPPPIPMEEGPKGKAGNQRPVSAVLESARADALRKGPPPPPPGGSDPEGVAAANTERLARRRRHEPLRARAKSPPLPSRIAAPRARGSEGGAEPDSFDQQSQTRPDSTPLPRRAAETPARPQLTVRFLRGDRWIAARVRNLGVRSAHVATSAPPRIRDIVILELGFRDLRVAITGHVTDVTLGRGKPHGFRVQFPEDEGAASSRLVALLMEARAAGLTLDPPPERAASRFPVRLPIRVRTGRGEVTAAALDVSDGGMFLATDYDLSDDEFAFQIPLDLGGPPVRGRARTVRAIDTDTASERGLYRGYGISITDLGERDTNRFRAFLDRVEKRSAKRVVVAANTGRAEELASCLTAVGYAAASRTNTDAVGELMSGDPNPPDVAVIDSSESGMQRARLLRSVFEKRQVPCVSARDQAAEETRAAVDRLLAIDR